MFKLAESDMSHRSRDHLSDIFQSVFSDNEIAKQFSMARKKALYIIQNGIEISKMIFVAVCQSKTFTLMFDETTTMQRKRQMDVLIWC